MKRRIAPGLFLAVLGFASTLAAGQGDLSKRIVPQESSQSRLKSLYRRSFALVIGINEYPHLPKEKWLQFAEQDAKDFAALLIQSYGFGKADVHLLLGKDANRDGILDALSDLSDTNLIQRDDRVIVYFSGHGQTVRNGTNGDVGFLIPSSATVNLADVDNPRQYSATCLSMRDVWEKLSLSPAKHTLLIADACYGGLVLPKGLSNELIASELARSARMALTAGGKGEEAIEDPALGHGIFTYKLLEELKSRAAAGQPFLISELYGSLAASVGSASHGAMNPQLGSDQTEGQIVFAPVEDVRLPFSAREARDLYYKNDFARALPMFEQLAARNDADGLAGLASCYLFGKGTEKDAGKAMEYALRSATSGSPWGMSRLGLCYENLTPPNYVDAANWYRKAADAGDAVGMNNLGFMYDHGLGLAQNFFEAAKLFRRSADAGFDLAMVNLGRYYKSGNGVPKDPAEAISWFRKSIAAGNVDAYAELGWMYDTGTGIAPDKAKAVELYQKAADGGSAQGMNDLGLKYQSGSGGLEKNLSKAAELFRKSADGGNYYAMSNLAYLYENGTGIEKDMKKAEALYRKAAALGNDDAKKALTRLGLPPS